MPIENLNKKLTYMSPNADFIERFSIRTTLAIERETLPKISFKSDEKTAKAIIDALIIDSDFWDDIQRDFSDHPTVKTTIYFKSDPNLDNFLELNSVRRAFLNQ